MVIENIMIEITNDCNRKCPICEANITKRPIKHLSEQNLYDIISILTVHGVKSISFTGGEPLLRWEQLTNVLKFCQEKSIETRLYTNGILLTYERILTLSKILNDIVVSYDSHDRAINLQIRNDLFFNNVKENIRTLSKTEINVFVISLCSAININDIFKNVNFINTTNVKGWMVQQFIPNGLGELYKSQFEISKKEFEDKILELKSIIKVPVLSYAYSNEDTKRVFINCEGNFIDYRTNENLGSAMHESTIKKIISSNLYHNKKRKI
ncbi:MAG: radical SAM protein [Chitinispirillales bacterium]|jgi:MoaA/NifB/PqqE/SkfB family radical SAM enzyme|nr:radical SAM protein [Chitinispirillales bacterium]